MKEQEVWDRCWRGAWLSTFNRSRGRTPPTVKEIFRGFEGIGLHKSARILDVGCGSATLARYWLLRGNNIIGLDISDNALRMARQDGVPCVKANAAQGLPFPDNTFDLVYTDALLEHFRSPEQVLKEVFRVSKKYVISIVPRDTFLNNLLAVLIKAPKEFKRKDNQWLELHRAFKPLSIKSRRSMFINLIILCEVDEVG